MNIDTVWQQLCRVAFGERYCIAFLKKVSVNKTNIFYGIVLKRPCIDFGVVRIDSAIVALIDSAILQLLLTRRSAIVNPVG